MDYEHQPTPGPAIWIGAGLLIIIGGASLLWVSNAATGDTAMTVIGWILVAAGIGSATAGIWRARSRRKVDHHSNEEQT